MRCRVKTADFNSAMERQSARVIDYLRISVTDRCNFRCTYCMPFEGVAGCDHKDILAYEEIVRFTRAAIAAGITRVRITGGEPLVRRDCPELVAMLAQLPGLRDLSLTTNGFLLEKHASQLWSAGLRRINISIDSLNPDRFARITRGARLGPVLNGLKLVLAMGFAPVKVNAVMLEGIEEDVPAFVALAKELPVHVRFIEFMPIGRHHGGVRKLVPRDRILDMIGQYVEMQPADPPQGGGPARYFNFPGAAGTMGFISSMSDHFCSSCNRIRLTADGKLRNCLFSDGEVDVRPLIEGDIGVLKQAILDSMSSKKFDWRTEHPGIRLMSQIGG